MKVGLLGGVDIQKYSIADVLWKKISELSGIEFDFEFIPVANFTDLCRFYWNFNEQKDFLGFNVALPWKSEMTKLVDVVDPDAITYNSINVVYHNEGKVFSSNTDVLGLEKALLGVTHDLFKKRVLVLGGGGAGLPCAKYLSGKYKCDVFVYDLRDIYENESTVVILKKRLDILAQSYDIVINATPVGKYFLDASPYQFSLPIDPEIIQRITHANSIVQEMNYFPYSTQLLKLAQVSNLKTISGVDMLVYQALATFKLYKGYEFSSEDVLKLKYFMKEYSINKENELLR